MSRRYMIAFTDANHQLIYMEVIAADDLLAALNHAKAVMPEAAVFCHIEDPEDEEDDDDDRRL